MRSTHVERGPSALDLIARRQEQRQITLFKASVCNLIVGLSTQPLRLVPICPCLFLPLPRCVFDILHALRERVAKCVQVEAGLLVEEFGELASLVGRRVLFHPQQR